MSWFDTKQSNGEVPVMLRLWGIRRTILLPLLPGPLWQTRHAGHCWRSRDELVSDVLLWTPSQGRAMAGRLARHTYSSSVPKLDIARKICQKQWTIGRGAEIGLEIPELIARHDDDDDDDDIVSCCKVKFNSYMPILSYKKKSKNS